MATYVNDLRLKEIATGDESGTWGTSTNTNLELIAEAFSYGTEAITTNADTHTTTIADGATDPGRSMYLKYTGTLDSACTITIGPNTVSKVWIIENATSGSQNIILSQGSGANITIPAGDTKVVYSDGAGSGAAFFDAFAGLKVTDAAQTNITSLGTLTGLTVNGNVSVDGGTIKLDGNYPTGTGNVALGDSALDDGSLSGNYNVAIGSNALTDLTSGGNNSAIGFNALTNLTTGSDNTAIGRTTLVSTTTGSNNTAVGSIALNVNTGDSNTAVGKSSLANNTTGYENTAVGLEALFTQTAGVGNTAVGRVALRANTANNNTAVGTVSLYSNTSGTNNAALGAYALQSNTTASNNTAVGASALLANTTGSGGAAVGYLALTANTQGTDNTAVGALSLDANTTGSNNSALGNGALSGNTTASNNTAVGFYALLSNTTQEGNTGVGWNALGDASSGLGRNTGCGYESNGAVTTGAANTALGWASGGVTTGNGNTVIGYITTTGATAAENRIVIGYNVTGTANNRVHLGSSSGHIYNDFTSNATWTQTSDERKKKDIVDDTLGLDFINDLRTTKYKFKARSEFPKEWVTYDAESTTPVDNKVHHGLIAQEVKQALDNAGVDSFEGWDELPDGTQQLSREMFVIPLIKAVQELSAQNADLLKRIEALEG